MGCAGLASWFNRLWCAGFFIEVVFFVGLLAVTATRFMWFDGWVLLLF